MEQKEEKKKMSKSTKIVLIVLGVIIGLGLIFVLCFDYVYEMGSGWDEYDNCSIVVGKISHNYYGVVESHEHSDIDMSSDGKTIKKLYRGKFSEGQYKRFKKDKKKIRFFMTVNSKFCNYILYPNR